MKIFYLVSRFPLPLIKGDKLRAFHQIKNLSQKHEIILCAISGYDIPEKDIQKMKEYCSDVFIFKLGKTARIPGLISSFIRGLPFQVGFFYSSKLKAKIHDLISKIKPDLVFTQLIRTSEYTKDLADYTKLLDYQDTFSKGFERRLKTEFFLKRMFFYIESKRLKKYENKIFDYFEKHTIITRHDRDAIPHPRRNEIRVIRNGVDSKYFQKKTSTKVYDIVFIGGMQYAPNVDAVTYVVEKIMPLLKLKYPNLKFLIAGANPTKKVLELNSENVIVTGWVDDIRECYLQGKIFLAPMQIGVGLQNKLLEAMAMKLPCVTSPLANQPLGAKEGEEVLIGDLPTDYAHHIQQLLDDEDYATKIGMNGYYFVMKNYDWDTVIKQLNDYILE